MKKTIAFSIVILMIFSIFVVFASSVPSDSGNGTVANPMVTGSYSGHIIIEPNGVIMESTGGAPIKQSGSVYTLTGNITGTITIEMNSSVLDGAGFVLSSSDSFYAIGYLNISASHDVTVSNLTVNATQSLLPSTGVFLYNTSHDKLTGLKVVASGAGIMVSNNTSFVNITNSRITGPQFIGSGFLLGGVATGSYLNMKLASTSGPISTNTTSNITLYGDNVSSYNYAPPIISNSVNTTIKDTKIIASGLNAPAAVMMIRNGSSVIDTSFNLNSTKAVNMSNPFNSTISGLEVAGNVIYANFSSASHFNLSGLIATNGTSYISNNTIKASVEIPQEIFAITAIGVKTIIKGNVIDFYDGQSSNLTGIAVNTLTTIVNNNQITGLDPASSYQGIIGLANYGYVSNSTISGNTMLFNNIPKGFSYGAALVGFNDTITGNRVTIDNGLNSIGLGLEPDYNGPTVKSHTNFTDNFVNLVNATYGTGLYFVSSNRIYNGGVLSQNEIMLNGTGPNTGIVSDNVNNVTISGNVVTTNSSSSSNGNSLIYSGYSNNLTVSDNQLNGVNKGNNYALQIMSDSHGKIDNNSITNTPFGVSIAYSDNFTIDGNYFTNTSQDALGFNTVENATIYHNDFLNYTGISMTGIKNIRFNLSYPIGGNYWSNLSGHSVDQKSGSGQNIAGSDGINDTPFSPSKGVTDYYPLVSKWVRPQAVFHAPDGINGTT
jgi:parallel beta-helix repeat protein